MTPLVATPAQVAEALQVSEDIVRDLKESGRLPFVQLSRQRWAVPWASLSEWLEDEARANTVAAELEADGVDIPAPRHRGVA